MKTLFYTKTIIALAVAVAAAAAAVSQAQEQPIPPPAAESALPANISPGSPLAEVVKLVQAGVEVGTINSYILNSPSAFNLDADKIVYLKDVGVPNELVNAMIERDKILYAASVTPAPAPAQVAAPAPVTVSTEAVAAPFAPPPTEVTVNYFYDTLTPYGSWVAVEGYGRCWRPTAVRYDPTWRPYCDRGHWVYTDCGWYWNSDYSWGATFHYGRWFQDPRWGWCWYPDTVWGPSWVTWRAGGDYCGWAPLPPFAVYHPGVGFYYRGASVAVGFDFGLGASCFMFVSAQHFCDYHPRSYCVESTHVTQVYHQTTVINNYNVNNNVIVNHGISASQISSAAHHPIEQVHVASIPNAGQHGWRGEGWQHTVQNSSGNNHANLTPYSGSSQLHQTTGGRANTTSTTGAVRHDNFNQSSPSTTPGGNHLDSSRSTLPQNLNGQANNNQGGSQLQHYGAQSSTVNSHYLQSQQTGGATSYDHRQTQTTLPSGYGEHGQAQTASRDQLLLQSQQTHNYNNSTLSGSQQHGASQLQQNQAHVESVTHSYSPPPTAPATTQNQSHSSNTGSNGGSNNGSNKGANQTSDPNKPNH